MCNGSGMDDYRLVNRALWDERGHAHAASADYSVDRSWRLPHSYTLQAVK